jgi:hypothetical protein
MGKVLVEASKVTCGPVSPHLGTVKMTGAARLVVNDSKALTTASVIPLTPPPPPTTQVAGCTNNNPCAKVEKMTEGTSTRLKVDGEFVVLDSLQAKTDRASAVKVVSVNNNRLEAE